MTWTLLKSTGYLNVPHFEFVWSFLKLCIFCKSTAEVTLCPCQCFLFGSTWCRCVSLLIMFTLITWLRWCLLGFSMVKLLFFCFVIKYLMKWYFETLQRSWWSCLQQLLIWYLPRDGFLFFIPSTFTNRNSTVRKSSSLTFLFSTLYTVDISFTL